MLAGSTATTFRWFHRRCTDGQRVRTNGATDAGLQCGWLGGARDHCVRYFQFGGPGNPGRGANAATQSATSGITVLSHSASAPRDIPRFVNVASLNVRHTPSISGELIMMLPRATALRVLDRQEGWFLVDLNPPLEAGSQSASQQRRSPQDIHATRFGSPRPVCNGVNDAVWLPS